MSIPPQQDRPAEDDDVERHEQLRARLADVHADPHRNARECEHRKEPRQTPERHRETKADPERTEETTEQFDRTVRRDRGAEHARAERGEAEAGDSLALRLRNEQQRKTETRDRPAEVREVDHRTITAARLDVTVLAPP